MDTDSLIQPSNITSESICAILWWSRDRLLSGICHARPLIAFLAEGHTSDYRLRISMRHLNSRERQTWTSEIEHRWNRETSGTSNIGLLYGIDTDSAVGVTRRPGMSTLLVCQCLAQPTIIIVQPSIGWSMHAQHAFDLRARYPISYVRRQGASDDGMSEVGHARLTADRPTTMKISGRDSVSLSPHIVILWLNAVGGS